MAQLRNEDLYGRPRPFEDGAPVYKTGSGYSGPGRVATCFLGRDWHWRVVVEHRIEGGQGEFYHIYGWGQLRVNPAEEREHGDVPSDQA